ncbi:transposase [Alicyclobacillus curvatus]|nr:transposase [Alicyclobacillus curvatus]
MVGSMNCKGNCWDNACIESFHGVIKRELIHLENYTTRAHAQRDIWEYIEIWYNRRRIHSSIGYRTPAQFGALYYTIRRNCGGKSMISIKSYSEFSYILCSVCPSY